jgi:PAS domain S-box-containing protein
MGTDHGEHRTSSSQLGDDAEAFRASFEHASVGMAHVGRDGRWLRVNQRLCDLLGYERHELLELTFADITHPDDLSDNVESLRRLVEGGAETYDTEKRYLRKDGSLLWVTLCVSAVRREDGSFAHFSSVLEDITDRKRAEARLAESERFVTSILETSPNLIYIYDLVEHRNVYANREVTQFLGYTPQEVLSFGPDLFEKVLHPDDAALVAEHHARCAGAGDGDVLEIEYRMRDSDDRWRCLRSRDVCFARDEQGHATQILGFTEDVTLRKAGELALRESEAKYRSILEASPDDITITDLEGRILGASPAALKLLACGSEEDLLGRSILDFVCPEDRERAAADIALMFEGVMTGPGEYRGVRADGTAFDTETNAEFVRDAEGQATGMVFVVRDITERKRAEGSLRVYAELLEASPAAITVHTPQGEFLYANEGTLGMHGYPREEFLALDLHELDMPESAALIDERFLVTAEQGENSFEVAHRRKDGSVLPLVVNNRLANWDGREVVLSVATDITDRKRAEAELAAYAASLAELAEERERNLQRLAASLSSTIAVVSRVVEIRDPYTAGHERRVSELAVCIAEEMGMSPEEVQEIRTAALVHDVGKVSVPAEILTKPGRLTATEFTLIQGHSQSGYDILSEANMGGGITEMVYQHHERCDGSGYPRGLNDDELLAGAKVLAVADVVEAMIAHRPYRPGLGVAAALAEIERGAGLQYDPAVVAACLTCFRDQRFTFSTP